MDTPLVLAPEPFANPERIDLPAGVPVVELHHADASLADLPDIFDAGYQVLATLGPAGPGYAIYDGDLSQRFAVTIGFPVAAAPADLPDGVQATTFPSGPALAVSHLGPFDGLAPAWERLTEEARPAGASGRVVEVYVTDPSVTEADRLRTDLLALL